MKLTTLLLIVSLFKIQANSYSQTTKINLDADNLTIAQIFEEIENVSEFRFLYESNQINLNRKVTVHLKNKKITEVLYLLFYGTNTDYKVLNRQVILTQNKIEKPRMGPLNKVKNEGMGVLQREISGLVVDRNGDPLPGANILEKGTTNGTQSDFDGNFSLRISNENVSLIVSYVGFATKEVAVGQQNSLIISLDESTAGLDEVVITALGISREKKSLGYSISEVDGDAVNLTPQENVLNSLAGKVTGVSISQMDGLAGSSVNMIIRGATSLSSDNQPLFVVDGVPIVNSLNNFYEGADMGNAISDLDPSNIANVSVLKGPSAAALYGSRAGNGVVLITTRTGGGSKKGIGVNISSAITFDHPYKYINYQTKFGPGKAGVHMFEEDDNESWGPRLDAGEEWVQWNTNGQKAPLVSYNNRLTDFFQTGITYTNNVSVGGNYDLGDFRISVGDMNNTGIVPNTDLQRQSFNLNGTYKVSPKFRVQGNIGVSESSSDNRPVVDGGRNTVVRSVYEMSAHVNINDLKDYWEPGLEGVSQVKYKNKQNNPWFLVHENTISFLRDRTVAKFQFDWDIMEDLTLTGRYSRDSYTEGRQSKKGFSTYGQLDGGYNVESLYRKESNFDLILAYNKKINKSWDINSLIGVSDLNIYGNSLGTLADALVVPDLFTISNAVPGTVRYNSEYNEKTIKGVYGMISVGYENMLFLDVTGRNDWSSTLPAENNSYFYPSASLSLLMSNIFNMPSWIPYAKLRAGWAKVGNDIAPYQLQQYFSTAADWGDAKRMYQDGILRNNRLKPEIATSKEIGFDIKLLDYRLGLEATYYEVENKNQVLNISVPVESGATNKLINAGLISSRGWEIGLNSTPIIAGDFKMDLGINVSRNRTKIEELSDGMEFFNFGEEGDAIVRTYVGETIGDIYARPVLTVKDENSPYFGYPIISNGGLLQKDNNPENLKKIGNFNNDFTMGFQPKFSYKSLSLSANIDWRQGGEFFSGSMRFFRNNGQLENTLSGTPYDPNSDIVEQIKANPDAYFGYWVGGRTEELGGFDWGNPSLGRENDASFHPGVREVVVGGNKEFVENLGGPGTIWKTPFDANKNSAREFAEHNIYSATYVKLRELALTYDIPKTLIQKTGLQKVSVSLVAKNLFEWTEAGINFDPERAFKGGDNWVQGIEYYNTLPWVASYGFKLNIDL
ncbi:Vitamin B12 transporter BtuB [Arenibacter antarcticus]|uniref:SusC/RagA family TonB-linked outer membrane protein n=1 Tax=Arenibacter antarcticus TaxID=2040469 RepID=A0ABW5VC38_9FLAO|nr:SusC/RagA family TonB-linked outer membrane protein [Arenibacter sp. H213]